MDKIWTCMWRRRRKGHENGIKSNYIPCSQYTNRIKLHLCSPSLSTYALFSVSLWIIFVSLCAVHVSQCECEWYMYICYVCAHTYHPSSIRPASQNISNECAVLPCIPAHELCVSVCTLHSKYNILWASIPYIFVCKCAEYLGFFCRSIHWKESTRTLHACVGIPDVHFHWKGRRHIYSI